MSEGSHKTWGIPVKRTDGSVVKVIQDHVDGVQAGSCVAAIQQDSELCHAAKEALAQAKTQAELGRAMQKIKVLYH